jgi:uncharacterized membrane protein YdjX (TVP38/TMEM64 family)
MHKLIEQPHLIRRFIVTSTIFIVIIVLGYWLEHHVATIEAWLAEMGHWAGVGYILLFVLLTPMLFSVDVLCIIAGALFNLAPAIGYVLTATMLAAAVIFYISRHLAKDKVHLLLQKHPKLTLYERMIEENGFKVMFLLRLLPLPFALMSYLFAITRVQFIPYWIATMGIFFYNSAIVYFGYIAMHMSKKLSQGEDYTGPHHIMLTGGILGAILVLYIITKIAHAQIEQIRSEPEKIKVD